jgi:hypothetical protein
MRDDRHPTYSGEAIQNPETHHETSDVDVRALMWFVVIFVVFGFVTHIFLWLLFRFYVRMERHPSQNAPALTAMQRSDGVEIPTGPRLQPFPTKDKSGLMDPPNTLTPAADMEKMIADTNAVLNNYGWVDQQKGIVHIPIEEAKKKALQQLNNVAPGFSPVQNGLKPVPTSAGAQQ